MEVMNPEKGLVRRVVGSRPDTLTLAGIALVVAVIHVLTNGRYGFHRDELQFLSDARHLDWGFVAYPPFTPFVERIGLEIFGVSMVGLRLFSVIAQAMAIVVTGWMAWELGGGRLAQVAAALAVAMSGLPVFEATEFQYSTFDYLWWVLIVYFVIRLLKSENPRWWIAIGVGIGVGLQTKYTICFFIAVRDFGWHVADSRAAIFFEWVVLGWSWSGAADLSAEFLVAGSAWICFCAFFAAYPCA
jgi:dolichyl-phosphate-mannose-protein mannosyltransferase